MPPIDPKRLTRAMDGAGYSTKHLSEQVGISIQYAHDLTTGHRRLKRNPALRKKIAETLRVPTDWIEEVESQGRLS